MKVVGIITEYNPFHNGHLHQIDTIKKETGADYIIIAMSGDFVQRGTPALLDKYARANMALACGADLVFELPVLWSTASAEYFASAGVELLDQLGVVDSLCFGIEGDYLEVLTNAAHILLEEPPAYREALRGELVLGSPFPVARSKALLKLLPFDSNMKTIFESPNSILALEYIKELLRRNSSIAPLPILRKGAGYHSHEISSMASASGIRNLLQPYMNVSLQPSQIQEVCECITKSVPEDALSIIKNYLCSSPLLSEEAFSLLLHHTLMSQTLDTILTYGDVSESLGHKMIDMRKDFSAFSQYCELLKSKDITYSRICRALIHLLLHLPQSDYLYGKESGKIPYLRMLGFRKSSREILSMIKKNSPLPLITKMADAKSLLSSAPDSAYANQLFSQDVHAADIYRMVQTDISKQVQKNEYNHGIILVS